MPDTKARSCWPVFFVISLVLLGGPALAHGEEGEAEPVDMVEPWADEDGLLSIPALGHGLTERVEGGLRSPGVVASALAHDSSLSDVSGHARRSWW